MQVSKEDSDERKLVAVVGASGDGVFLPSGHSVAMCYYVNTSGFTIESKGTLEEKLAVFGRKGVYSGESIKLDFSK